MAIIVKSPRQIEFMREAGKITAGARSIARQGIAAGVTTAEIDREVYNSTASPVSVSSETVISSAWMWVRRSMASMETAPALSPVGK